MKIFNSLLILTLLVLGLSVKNLHSQTELDNMGCCGDEEQMLYWDEWNYWQGKKDSLLKILSALDADISKLKAELNAKDRELDDAEAQLYAAVGSDKNGVDAFRKNFAEAEKLINACKDSKSAAEIRTKYFNQIEASKIRCLPEFWDRYLAMKTKLEQCEGKVEQVTGQYTVVKGDCLYKIAQSKYGNGRCWPVIWEANKNGVISAPPRTPKTIKNPNLIYPGQVLRIPDAKNCKDLKTVTPRKRTWRPRTK
ncbi:MAG: LysM domain-containing protein [Chlorobi bacterium OLB4]|jgi:nucleoid-associated protein YgaU|nr:MAG: LysM domain-containing protein [Chlorobi bacterium OLB4]MBW7856176.1 LysM peptidoglycan-binding domain-containing protein [Ignavibacteria bacterium]OQY78010.1 MAG: hypothetical protein B6D43_05715 [Ignavibacteriales bacterium UTCHB1]